MVITKKMQRFDTDCILYMTSLYESDTTMIWNLKMFPMLKQSEIIQELIRTTRPGIHGICVGTKCKQPQQFSKVAVTPCSHRECGP